MDVSPSKHYVVQLSPFAPGAGWGGGVGDCCSHTTPSYSRALRRFGGEENKLRVCHELDRPRTPIEDRTFLPCLILGATK